MYSFVSRVNGMAFIILRVADNDAALKALQEGGHLILTEDYLK